MSTCLLCEQGGAHTETELKEKSLRVQDGLNNKLHPFLLMSNDYIINVMIT